MSEETRAPSSQDDGARRTSHELAPWPIGCDPAQCPLRIADRRALAYLHALAARSPDGRGTLETGSLTPREREVLESLCHDLTCEQIALQMGRSAVTIRNHVQHILRKTGAHSIPEVVARHLLRGRP